MILDSLCYSNERLKEAIPISLQEHIVPVLVRILQEGPEREKIIRVPKSAHSITASMSGEDGSSAAQTPVEGDDGDFEERTIVEGHKTTVLERTCSVLTVLWFASAHFFICLTRPSLISRQWCKRREDRGYSK